MALSGSKSYTLTIGTGPLAITIGTIHSASGLDASSYAEALPTLSLSPKISQGKTASVRPPAPRSSSPLEVYHLLASGRPDMLSNLHLYGHRRPLTPITSSHSVCVLLPAGLPLRGGLSRSVGCDFRVQTKGVHVNVPTRNQRH